MPPPSPNEDGLLEGGARYGWRREWEASTDDDDGQRRLLEAMGAAAAAARGGGGEHDEAEALLDARLHGMRLRALVGRASASGTSVGHMHLMDMAARLTGTGGGAGLHAGIL